MREYDDLRFELDEDKFRLCILLKAKSNQRRKDFIQSQIRVFAGHMRNAVWKCLKKNSKAVSMQQFAMFNALSPEGKYSADSKTFKFYVFPSPQE